MHGWETFHGQQITEFPHEPAAASIENNQLTITNLDFVADVVDGFFLKICFRLFQ